MFAKFFIEHPVLANVIAFVIMLLGGVAVFLLPVSEYPPITPPTVQVTTTYPGASAKTLVETVALPIEQRSMVLVIWLSDDQPIGFSTSDKIIYGEQANMHLHVIDPGRRHQGAGAECVRRSVDLYFGPSAPPGKEANWLPTAGEDFFLILRLYGPEKAFFEKARPTSLIKRFETPEEIATLVAYIASPLASGTTGAALRVDGGCTKSAF